MEFKPPASSMARLTMVWIWLALTLPVPPPTMPTVVPPMGADGTLS
jgi:hypothetical protein